MSLINDALRRARQAQQPAPVPATAGLQPVEPTAVLSRGFGWAVPLAVTTIGLLGLGVAWQFSRNQHPVPLPLAARTVHAKHATPQPVPATAQSAPTSPHPVEARRAALASGPAVGRAEVSGSVPAPLPAAPAPAVPPLKTLPQDQPLGGSRVARGSVKAGGNPPPARVEAAQASRPAAAAPAASGISAETARAILAPPVPLKLQGIIYAPRRASAVIGGRTFFVGDALGELRVAAILRNSVILTGGGRTNVLYLVR